MHFALLFSGIGVIMCFVGVFVQIAAWIRVRDLLKQVGLEASKAQKLYDASRNSAGYVYSTLGQTPSSYLASLNPEAQQFFVGANIPQNTGDIDGLPPAIRADLEELFSFDWSDAPPEQSTE